MFVWTESHTHSYVCRYSHTSAVLIRAHCSVCVCACVLVFETQFATDSTFYVRQVQHTHAHGVGLEERSAKKKCGGIGFAVVRSLIAHWSVGAVAAAEHLVFWRVCVPKTVRTYLNKHQQRQHKIPTRFIH